VTTASSRSKMLGVFLAASMSLQSSLVAYAAGNDINASSAGLQKIAFAPPDTSRFSSLEQAVGISPTEAEPTFGAETAMFASDSGNPMDASDYAYAQQNAGHFISLTDLAAGNVPSANPLLDRADLLASADPVTTAAPVVLNATITNDPAVAKGRADDLTRQAMLKIVELERFNLHYKQEVAKQGRWRGWRYGGWQEVNGGLNLAGAIVSVGERGSHLRQNGGHIAGSIHTSVQQNTNILALVGNSIGALAALTELGINEYHELEAHHHGYGPGASRAHVEGLRSDIDRLLAERSANIAVERQAGNLAGHAVVDDAEGKVLRDLRDQGLLEFERYHVAARRSLAFQNSQYFFDFAKYTTNAIGFEFAFLALHKHHRHWNLRAGVLFEVSGAIYMFGPILSRVIAKGVAEGHKRYVRGTVQEAEAAKVDDLVKDKATLDTLVAAAQSPEDASSAVGRASIYGDQSKVFQDELASSTKDRAKAKLTATQNIGSGLFVGACKVASGVMFNIPGGNENFRSQSDRAGRVTNADLFTASVISLPAITYSMLDTARINIMGEINRKKLLDAGTHPNQLVAKRFAQLDDIEKRLGGTTTTTTTTTTH
jgi:hypothetical protein